MPDALTFDATAYVFGACEDCYTVARTYRLHASLDDGTGALRCVSCMIEYVYMRGACDESRIRSFVAHDAPLMPIDAIHAQ